jgi:hypothetical protein
MRHWRPRGGRRPLRNKCQGVLQADASASVGLAGVVTPQKQNKAAWNRDNRRKKRAGNILDDKVEPAPLGVERAQRSAKKAETKGQAPLAAKAGHTAVWVRTEAKAIKEIDSEELDDKGAQARMGADCAGKIPKRPRTKRRVLTPVKGWAARPPGQRLQ